MANASGGAPAGTGLTTPEAVRRVAEHPDAVTRNLRITQSYHELTLALETFTEGADVPWTAFAVWASKQAGSFIRHEEVPAPLRRFLGLEEASRPSAFSLRGLLLRKRFLTYVRCTVEEVASNLGEGNRLVYAKLGPLFARFLSLVRDNPQGNRAAIADFLADLEQDPTARETLTRAFTQYYEAVFETDSKLRAERMMVTNLLVGFHEQTRLQDAIDGALSAPINTALDDPERQWTSLPVPLALRRLGAAIFRWILAPAIRSFEDEWKKVATECLMTLALPSGELALGDDVPPLADGSAYSAALDQLTLPEAQKVVAEFDTAPGTTRGSGARDWTDLGDRMGYISELFRSRQQERELLEPPFDRRQVAEIHAGRVPEGRL